MKITERRLEGLKHDLAQYFPQLKPTVRVEALARGFGFRRYVDLLQWSRTPQGLEREFQADKAAEYANTSVEAFKFIGR